MAAAVTYPKISRKVWWLLRERFKKTIPSVVTPTLVSSISPMADGSARSNVISPLRELGLLDESNKPTAWASRWRDDDEYAAVCHEIRAAVYPSELVESFGDADISQKQQIKSWFMKVGHVGEAAAKMYTDTFLLLTQADLTQAADKPAKRLDAKPTTTKAKVERKTTPGVVTGTGKAGDAVKPDAHGPTFDANASAHRRGPAIHIDVQVHISPDTSPEQIDRIFESMAKHLGTYIK